METGLKMKGKDTRPRLLDLFSCAGIGADGYVRAGWRVTCVDTDAKALAWCPWDTMRADAMELLKDQEFIDRFDVIHASPPCQGFTAARELAKAQGKGDGVKTLDLLTPTLAILEKMGNQIPWVVENVPRSPLGKKAGAVQLCGSAFGLKVQRHRLFLSNVKLEGVMCDHASFEKDPVSGKPRPWGVYYAAGDNIPSGGRTCRDVNHAMECMGVGRRVPWDYLKEGLPPAFTHHIGMQMKKVIE